MTTLALPLTISIVSHGHDAHVSALLDALVRMHESVVAHVVLIHNLPSAGVTPRAWPFRFTEIFNPQPLGFGANHNQAFAHCETDFFAVLNPDVTHWSQGFWAALVHTAQQPCVGCAYPLIRNEDGSVQDNEREVPTPWALWRRRVQRLKDRRCDWVSAACWVVPARVWGELGGLDVRYFLYCEDVDFCLRLRLQGYGLQRADGELTHAAQRSSHRKLTYLRLHIASLLRLWCTPPMWRYLCRRSSSRT